MAYNYDDQIPTWANEGTEPAESVKLEGYKPGYKPPASYFNWFWNRTLRWLNDLRTKLSGLHTQVQSVEAKVKTLEDKDYDVSADSVLAKLKTVDGAESGVDADLLDGKHASAFADVDHTHTQYAPSSHTHALATESSNGFMSSEMFSKLKAFDPNTLSTYTHPSTHPASMITGLHTVATSGNYADLVNKPVLSGVATSGNYNDLLNLPTPYSHPATHPASMITETENIKMMTAAERVKLANMVANANYYVHPDTHPASMITGLEDYMSTLGYGKVANGTFVGDGTGTCYFKVSGSKITTEFQSPKTIILTFSPNILLLINKTTGELAFLYPNSYLSDVRKIDYANYTVLMAYLTGNQLQVVNSTSVNGLGGENTGWNTAGYTYYWLAF